MSEKVQTADRRDIRTREPTGREYAIAHGGGILAAFVLGGFALALGWSRAGILLGGLILVAVYVPVAVTYLFRFER